MTLEEIAKDTLSIFLEEVVNFDGTDINCFWNEAESENNEIVPFIIVKYSDISSFDLVNSTFIKSGISYKCTNYRKYDDNSAILELKKV